jgi:4-diphosphocytidyl-2-C-methyl-D-erythritol kinase
VIRAPATAKINLALVVGPSRSDGKHELATVYQRVALADRVALEPSDRLRVDGFAEDTIVRRALESIAAEVGITPAWRARVTKRIPVAAGLGGGSSDAATVLRLANATLTAPLAPERLSALAATLGADIPFFLASGPQLGLADGTELASLDLPQDFAVLLLVPNGSAKESTASVYRAFDERHGSEGYEDRRRDLLDALGSIERPEDLATLPRNDLVSSELSARIEQLGAFRADVTGAGPAVYGLFLDAGRAREAARVLRSAGRTIVTTACWYG